MSAVQNLTVGQDQAEQRLDRWIRRTFPDLSQGQVEKMCRKGEIRVDGGRVKANTRVSPGQMIRIPPLPDGRAKVYHDEPKISENDRKMMMDLVILLWPQLIKTLWKLRMHLLLNSNVQINSMSKH